MEEKFLQAWRSAQEQAIAQGVRLRIFQDIQQAHRQLGGSRCSEGFDALAEKGLLRLSLEALAVDKQFTPLFSDQEANNALTRLLEAGYEF